MAGLMLNSEDLGYVYDYTGLHFHRVRLIKSVRKDHICLFCKNVIPSGSPSAYHYGLEMTWFYYYHVCMSCNENPTLEGEYATDTSS